MEPVEVLQLGGLLGLFAGSGRPAAARVGLDGVVVDLVLVGGVRDRAALLAALALVSVVCEDG